MTTEQELQHAYRQSLGEKRVELRRRFDALCDEDASVPQVRSLHLLLHRLAGSAGSYGYPTLSGRARQLERAWRQWLDAAPTQRSPCYQVCASQAVAFAELLGDMQGLAQDD